MVNIFIKEKKALEIKPDGVFCLLNLTTRRQKMSQEIK